MISPNQKAAVLVAMLTMSSTGAFIHPRPFAIDAPISPPCSPNTPSRTCPPSMHHHQTAWRPSNTLTVRFATGGDDVDDDEILRIGNLASADDADAKYGNLKEYVNVWSALFEGDTGKSGLTTPVTVVPSNMGPGGDVTARSGVRIEFKPTNTGYDDDDDDDDDDDWGDKTEKSGEAKKEGGVEVLAEMTAGGEVRVRARRCNMDDDTFVKEMSEETILEKLREGIAVWKKEQK